MKFHEVMAKYGCTVKYGKNSLEVHVPCQGAVSTKVIDEISSALGELGIGKEDIKLTISDGVVVCSVHRYAKPIDNVEELVSRRPELKDFAEFLKGKGLSKSYIRTLLYTAHKYFVRREKASYETGVYTQAKKFWEEFKKFKRDEEKDPKYVAVDNHLKYRERDGIFKIVYDGKQYYVEADRLKNLIANLPDPCTLYTFRKRLSRLFKEEISEAFTASFMRFISNRAEFDCELVVERGRLKLVKEGRPIRTGDIIKYEMGVID